MDALVSLGYTGQEIVFVKNDQYAYITGQSIFVVDINKGPTTMIWRPDNGVNKITANIETNKLVIAPNLSGEDLEVINLETKELINTLQNPTSTKFIDLSYSRSGNRLYGLTDYLDHRVVCWDIETNQVLFVTNLNLNYSKCSVSPINDNKLVLTGENGLSIGTVGELMGLFSMKLENVKLNIEEDEIDNQSKEKLFAITFSTWTPNNHLFIGTLQGFIFEINPDNLTFKLISKTFLTKRRVATSPYPTSAALSISNLIVGTSDGMVFWYGLDSINEFLATSDNSNDKLCHPVQEATGGGCVSTISISPDFNTLHTGSSVGVISQFGLNIIIKEKKSQDDDDNFSLENATNDDEILSASAIRTDVYQSGAVLCATSLSLPLKHFARGLSPRSTDFTSLYVTGSHLGQLSFWQQPDIDSDPITIGMNCIRRSIPRMMKFVSSVSIGEIEENKNNRRNKSTTSACTLRIVPGLLPEHTYLYVGTSDGFLEIWKISTRNEEEDDEEEEEEGKKTEEGEVKIKVERVNRARLYNVPISILSLTNTSHGKFVAVGSHFDSYIHIISCAHGPSEADISIHFSLDKETPATLNWNKETLWIGCKSGNIYSFGYKMTGTLPSSPLQEYESHLRPQKQWESDLSSIIGGLIVDNKLMLVDVEQVPLKSFDLPDMSDDNSKILSRKNPTMSNFENLSINVGNEHSDIVICNAVAPSNNYWATGCADGSLFIWTKNIDDAWILGNKITMHNASILSLCFSQDSSQIMTSCADGSIFIISVDRATSIPLTPLHNNHHANESKPALNSENIDGKTWIERRKDIVIESLGSLFNSKVTVVGSAVNDVAARLNKLLLENSGRTELEQLDRSEFVIDVAGRDNILVQSNTEVNQLKNSYLERNLSNELISARIRQKCWDSMDSKSSFLFTFNCGYDSCLNSFSVKKYTDDEAILLEKMKRMRSIEVQSQRGHTGGIVHKVPNGFHRISWATSVDGCSPNLSWINNDGNRWPCKDIIEMLLEKDKQELESSKDTKEKKEKAETDTDVMGGEEEDLDASSIQKEFEIDDKNIFNLLYAPQTVRTQIQKRTQIILLKEVVRMIRTKFNDHFEKLRREKEEVIASIGVRNARIEVILEELHHKDEVVYPELANTEIPGTTVLINDSEIKSRPYESEASRNIRLKKEEEKRRQDAENDKEDVKGRALEEMMHGTLDVKRDVFAEASALHKPDWMHEIPVADMNESELKEYEAFEIKFKELQEEQAKYRKSLEQELRRIKGEIVDARKNFDDKLINMMRLKISTQREVLSQELYMSRIAFSMAKREQSWSSLKRTEKNIEISSKVRLELRETIQNFAVKVDEVKNLVNNAQDDERNLDRTFKRDLQSLCNTTFDQDALKVFTQLYRQRTLPVNEDDDSVEFDGEESGVAGKGSNAGPNAGSKGGSNRANSNKRSNAKKNTSSQANSNTDDKKGKGKNKQSKNQSSAGGKDKSLTLGPMQEAARALKQVEKPKSYEQDPFYHAILQIEKFKKIAEAQIPLLEPLSLEGDCPEGFQVDQFTWSQLQELRNIRIKKEIEAKMISIKHLELRKKLDFLTSEDSSLTNSINVLRNELDETTKYLKSLEKNVEVVVALRQGQDEVDGDAVVTNYDHSVLVPAEVVDKFNSRIKELGKEKIAVLSRIKEFRRKINLIDWEASHLGLEAKHFEEYYTDLQLLRVTRELQLVIREGSDEAKSKERLDKVSVRKDFMQKDAETKVIKLRKNIDVLKRQLIERSQESSVLEEKIEDVTAQVISRQNVKQSRDDARGRSGDAIGVAAKKMKKIVVRSHLVDTARSQAEEIDYLRQELDKMRQKTFPSFVRKRVSSNPDDR
jgi:hypothetical protein